MPNVSIKLCDKGRVLAHSSEPLAAEIAQQKDTTKKATANGDKPAAKEKPKKGSK